MPGDWTILRSIGNLLPLPLAEAAAWLRVSLDSMHIRILEKQRKSEEFGKALAEAGRGTVRSAMDAVTELVETNLSQW